MEDDRDDPTLPTPIPLGVRESWRGLHGLAEIDDEQWWLQRQQILVRKPGDHGDWRLLTDYDLKRLLAADYIERDVFDRMRIRILR
ncbi:MAG: hypothetical protein GW854_01745 [Erythrobacter sp.]|nr:hypothetical protein [Erythrobacter sp.]